MFAFNWSTFCLVFAAIFALSQQKPLANEIVEGKKIAENSHSNDEKVNTTDSLPMMMAVDKTRSSYYPNSAGFAYYNLGQVQLPSPHYPTGWAYQPYQVVPSMNSMKFKNEESVDRTDARTFTNRRPTRPQSQPYQYPAYTYPAPPYPALAYPLVAPLTSSGLGYYSNYDTYSPLYRDAEEEKFVEITDFTANDKHVSPVQPFNQYTTRYWYESPVSSSSAMQAFSRPQMSQATPVYIRDSLPEAKYSTVEGNVLPASELVSRGITIDDQLQMHIPSDYVGEKLHHYLPTPQVMPLSYTMSNQRMGRAAEEQPKPYKPAQWLQSSQPWYIYDTTDRSPLSFKNMDLSQSMQDPIIAPQDAVYMEVNNLAEPSHVQSSRSVGPQMMMATYPNHEQQMRIAQMQFYNNMMTDAASQTEPLARDYTKQRDIMWSPNAPIQMGRSTDGNSPSLDQIIKKLEEVKRDFNALTKGETFSEGMKDANKQEKTDKNVHSDKSTVASSGASDGSKKSS